jgi:tripartite-type tricarboxylate transporter receptor subunit TctC
MHITTGKLRHVALAAALMAACGAAFAQSSAPFPSKPIRVVVTFPPGGSTDVIPRIVAQKLVERWGQPWIFDNRPGAGGQIGVDAVVKAPADGYTLLVGPSGAIAVNPSLYKKLAYDPVRDLAPVVPLVRTPMVLMVPASWSGTVKDLIEQSRAKAGQLSYGHGGNGTAMHLIGEMFKMSTGANLTAVPFKTSGEVITGVAGGQLNAGWVDSNFALTGQKGGRVRAIAVSNKERASVLPEVPTVAESGFPGFDAHGWFGFFAPAGTSADIVSRLNAEVRAALGVPEVRERILATGNEPWWSTPEDFGAFVRAEIAKWAKAVRQSGASAD